MPPSKLPELNRTDAIRLVNHFAQVAEVDGDSITGIGQHGGSFTIHLVHGKGLRRDTLSHALRNVQVSRQEFFAWLSRTPPPIATLVPVSQESYDQFLTDVMAGVVSSVVIDAAPEVGEPFKVFRADGRAYLVRLPFGVDIEKDLATLAPADAQPTLTLA